MSRTLLVGFDGARLDLCDQWIAEGSLPNLGAIVGAGASGPLRSTVPYNSAVAWTSLSTGMSAGRHGVFDFVLPRPGGYGYRVTTRQDRRVPALWNHAAGSGARVAVINIPITFPAEDLGPGVMVSGMDAPGLDDRAVSPGYLHELRSAAPDYRIMSKAWRAAEQGEFETAERELVQVLEARCRFVRALASKRDFDLVMVNFEATDGAQHFFWEHHDPSHPRHRPELASRFADTIHRVYQVSDRELGALIEAYDPDTTFVVSDHGGGPTNDWVLYMNDWLVSAGFLVPARKAAASVGRRLYGQAKKRLSVPARQALRPLLGRFLDRAKDAALFGDFDWSRSRAYAHMQPAVRLNLQGREPSGIVPASGRDEVLADLGRVALEARLPDGRPIFTEAHPAAEVYGHDALGGPDVVMELLPGLHIRSRNTTGRPGFAHRLSDLGIYLPSGVHNRTGMFAASGRGIDQAGRTGEADIHQVAPSVLAVMGVPTPPLDGRPFGFVSSPLVSAADAAPARDAEPTDLSEIEEAEVMERLRGLGYVD